ncbi:MAG: hypothetical protein R2704_07955 [Microthrixaceae bacterium]
MGAMPPNSGSGMLPKTPWRITMVITGKMTRPTNIIGSRRIRRSSMPSNGMTVPRRLRRCESIGRAVEVVTRPAVVVPSVVMGMVMTLLLGSFR